jgi:glycine/D-amino acid oxidase-like deaminating enzyme
MSHVVVAGAGIFGVTAALALRRRGHHVTLCDPGPIPHPLAESTDVSKCIRMDYGPDEAYAALMERALEGWRAWNRSWGETLYHETGVTFLARAPMTPGSFEHESHRVLTARGHRLERLNERAIRARFPAWNRGRARFVDGYFNPRGGFAESGKVVGRLTRDAIEAGVVVRTEATIDALVEYDRVVTGVTLTEGTRIDADEVVVAAGGWSTRIVPELSSSFVTVGLPVFHLRPRDPSPYRAEVFPVFGADISQTGWYGFPVNETGVVKVAHHGPGRRMDPGDVARRVVSEDELGELRSFLEASFPDLAGAEVTYTRICVYSDSLDEHPWIARDPSRRGLVIATGGSGHGFKFAPVLGDLVADALEGVARPELEKFRFRPELRVPQPQEAARQHR